MSEYESGLGCPHCDWTGSTFEDRAKHISDEHHGEYTGPSPDMLMAAERGHIKSKAIPAQYNESMEHRVNAIFSDRRDWTPPEGRQYK